MTGTRLRRVGGEIGIVVGTSVAALGVLRLLDTQIYTEPWTVDPWLYTALMTNFDSVYGWFNGTYYASRLPVVLPGLFLNSFLKPQAAYVVLHLTMYLAGATFLYLLIRSLFGVRVALFMFPVVLTNAAFVDAHTWDYVDGFVITYLAAGLYFLVSSLHGGGPVRLALAGFFLAAAVASNLFASLLALGGILAYIYGRSRSTAVLAPRRLALDAGLFSLGALILLGACGAFAHKHGGRTLFFMPSVDAARTLSTAPWKLPNYEWIWGEPRLLIPLFVAAAAALAYPFRPRSERAGIAPAFVAVVIVVFLGLAYVEFFRSGTFLQLEYYFDLLYPFIFVALATVVVSLVGTGRLLDSPTRPTVAALGFAAGVAPLVAVYGFDRLHLWGRRGSVVAVLLLVGGLAAVALQRFSTTRRFAVAFAPLAVALVVTGVNYASAASATTHGTFETHGSALENADDVFSIGAKLIDFMHANGLEDSVPGFWFDESTDPAMTGLQSLYFYAFTYLNTQMPNIDSYFRSAMESREPRNVVLLCIEPTCEGGPNAMRRAGYEFHPVAESKLSSRSKSIWVKAYAMG